MAITETARLERETEETRAQLEQTLGELRARMSPGQIFDQATDYFRNSSGRAYLSNLRDEVVHNPVPIALVGAGIAWLAISSAIGKRHGNSRADMARDWGRSAGIADDLSHGGHGPSAMQRARQTAEELTDDARSMAGEATETIREGMESVRQNADDLRDQAGELYERTAGGFRRVVRKASHYGHAAREAVQPDGALLNFCREQPMLVAGLGLAFGAALAAMIPTSRVERRTMGEASRNVQDRVQEVASETLHSVAGDDGDQNTSNEDRSDQAAKGEDRQRETRQTETERRAATGGENSRRQSWQSEAYGSREAAADLDRGVRQSDRASNVETEPQRAPYAEAAEAGSAGVSPVSAEEPKQRT